MANGPTGQRGRLLSPASCPSAWLIDYASLNSLSCRRKVSCVLVSMMLLVMRGGRWTPGKCAVRAASLRPRLGPVLLIVLLLGSGTSAPAADRHGWSAALESITAADLTRHVTMLADDRLEGREAGSRGGQAAAHYLQQTLARLGATGGGPQGSYRQPFATGYCNLLTRIDGSDSAQAAQWILVGADYDHVGYGTRRNSYGPVGLIHNGADDNASGTAAVLELIEAFTQLGRPPRRSILFALWDGEEKGMLGSRHWVAHPTVPLRDVVLAIHLDMVGRLRDDRLEVIGIRTGSGLRRLLSHATDGTDLWLDFNWSLKANADHWPFVERRIPTLLLHTGLHDQYHRPTDDTHLINGQGMREVVRYLFQLVDVMADGDQVPAFRLASRTETPATQHWRERLLAPPASRLGVSWQTNRGPEHGLELTRVMPETAAAAAGLRVGDRILAVDGRGPATSADLQAAVLQAQEQIVLGLARPVAGQAEPEQLDLVVRLTGQPVRVGISWREDDAEPGTVMLTRVVPGGPAARAGLEAGDRIYQIDGTDFGDGATFGQRLAEATGAVRLLVEQRGRLRTATLSLAPPGAVGSDPPSVPPPSAAVTPEVVD